MLRRYRNRLVTPFVALAVAVLTSQCREPTEVTLILTTDVACRDMKRLSITGGTLDSVERSAPTTLSDRCEGAGDLGTIVATPATSSDKSVAAFRVVLGLYRSAEECNADNNYKGCIVARRFVRFIAAKPLELPIRMYLVCEGVPCDANTTCNQRGQCVPATIDDPESCVPPRRCFPAGENPDDTPPTPLAADASSDASDAANDATTVNDAATDAGDASDGGSSTTCVSEGNAWGTASCLYSDGHGGYTGSPCVGYTIGHCANEGPYGDKCTALTPPTPGPSVCSQDQCSTTYKCLHNWCAYGCVPGGSQPDFNWVPVYTCVTSAGCGQ